MKPDIKTVCVLGLGYVGLPMAAVLASRGLSVLGVDINEQTVTLINQGKVPIVEPDLDILVNAAVATGRLKVAARPAPADAFIIAVPTPLDAGHKPDLAHVRAATDSIAPVLKAGDLVIIESTSPVGTTEAVASWLKAARPELAFPPAGRRAAYIYIAYSPERVLPGRILLELVENDRVIGGLDTASAERAAGLYRRFVKGECYLTDARTAELVKLAENSYRDVNIAFANEMARVCDRLGVDVWQLLSLANRHPRVDILKPGPGVGGHCIAVDPWFIVDSAPAETALIRAARQVNDARPLDVVAKVAAAAARLSRPRIACLGLAYKADIDDMRESPAVKIVRLLAEKAVGEILVVEPHTQRMPPELVGVPRLQQVELDAALDQADIVVLLVDHLAFRSIDRSRLAEKVVIDTRGTWRDTPPKHA